MAQYCEQYLIIFIIECNIKFLEPLAMSNEKLVTGKISSLAHLVGKLRRKDTFVGYRVVTKTCGSVMFSLWAKFKKTRYWSPDELSLEVVVER